MFATMCNWRSDKMNLWGYYFGVHDLYPTGWGFITQQKKSITFVSMKELTVIA